MAEQRPSFPWYPKDWLGSASVSAMPLAAQGLYARLLSFAWLSDGLPANEDALRRLASVGRAEWKRVWPVVAPLWEDRDGRLYQAKQERIRQQTDYTEAKRAAGRKGGRSSVEARREAFGSAQPRSKSEALSEADASASANCVLDVCQPSASGLLESKEREEKKEEKSPPHTPPIREERKEEKETLALHFARFWNAYPRKADRAKAEKAFARLKADEPLLSTMLAAIAWQVHTDQWQRGIIPLPATWLNGRRWEDERPGGALNGTPLDYDYDTAPIGQLPKVEW